MPQAHTPTYQPKQTQQTILRYAAMAAKWKEPPRDALDRLILTSAGVDLQELSDAVDQLEYVPFDPIVKRTEGTVRDKRTGEKC